MPASSPIMPRSTDHVAPRPSAPFIVVKQSQVPVVSITSPLRIAEVALAAHQCRVVLGYDASQLAQLRFEPVSPGANPPSAPVKLNAETSVIDGAELTQDNLLFLKPTRDGNWLAFHFADRREAETWLAAFKECRAQDGRIAGAVAAQIMANSYPGAGGSVAGGGDPRSTTPAAVHSSPSLQARDSSLSRVPAGVIPASAPMAATTSPRTYNDRASAYAAAEEVRLELTRRMQSQGGATGGHHQQGGPFSSSLGTTVVASPIRGADPAAAAFNVPGSTSTTSNNPVQQETLNVATSPAPVVTTVVQSAGGTSTILHSQPATPIAGGGGGGIYAAGTLVSTPGGGDHGAPTLQYQLFNGSKQVVSDHESSSRVTTSDKGDRESWVPVGPVPGVFVSATPPVVPDHQQRPISTSSVILQDGIPRDLPLRTIEATKSAPPGVNLPLPPAGAAIATSTGRGGHSTPRASNNDGIVVPMILPPRSGAAPTTVVGGGPNTTTVPNFAGNNASTTPGPLSPERRPHTNVPNPNAPQSSSSSSRSPRTTAEDENRKLHAEITRLTSLWMEALDEVAMHAKQIDQLRGKVTELERDKEQAAVSSQLQEEQTPGQQLQQPVPDQHNFYQQEITNLQARCVQLDEDKRNLELEIFQLTSEKANSGFLQTERVSHDLETLKEENSRLREEMENQRRQYDEKMENFAQHFYQEIENRDRQLQQFDMQLTEKEQQFREFEEKQSNDGLLYQLRAEMDRLQVANSRIEAEKTTTFQEVEQLAQQRNAHLAIIKQLVQMFVDARFQNHGDQRTRQEAQKLAEAIGSMCSVEEGLKDLQDLVLPASSDISTAAGIHNATTSTILAPGAQLSAATSTLLHRSPAKIHASAIRSTRSPSLPPGNGAAVAAASAGTGTNYNTGSRTMVGGARPSSSSVAASNSELTVMTVVQQQQPQQLGLVLQPPGGDVLVHVLEQFPNGADHRATSATGGSVAISPGGRTTAQGPALAPTAGSGYGSPDPRSLFVPADPYIKPAPGTQLHYAKLPPHKNSGGAATPRSPRLLRFASPLSSPTRQNRNGGVEALTTRTPPPHRTLVTTQHGGFDPVRRNMTPSPNKEIYQPPAGPMLTTRHTMLTPARGLSKDIERTFHTLATEGERIRGRSVSPRGVTGVHQPRHEVLYYSGDTATPVAQSSIGPAPTASSTPLYANTASGYGYLFRPQ
ncbi:unnamed protein product [Amoebophrya sp. A120]|nr:unnamed protein product [Amoebophrya sp. A120]|eukprot:GSA120T00023164001.1